LQGFEGIKVAVTVWGLKWLFEGMGWLGGNCLRSRVGLGTIVVTVYTAHAPAAGFSQYSDVTFHADF